ncbi:MAG TPA: metallophosphoesterase family protein [Candidatus Sumerlaeota bacterium]|nr:metallophosphoesterase family protein [Candidatus Sumerlaeota bacterium]HOR27238.1 metallophosphoesterase family protein [Candidatus Sumerlaeota bacterium]HPK01794.1 metallophosphoesterase family protein [Candidatus Sumerlaeota bacterium]
MSTDPPRRIAVFSDIHGNLHALRAVLDDIDRLGLRDLVCCGDVVGYGAFPNACCDILRERGIPTLAGNHDHAAIGMTDVSFFNEIARAAVQWTADELTDENRHWLRERPYTYCLDPDFFFVHASPLKPEQWGYVLTFGDARLGFNEFTQRCCFIGHSHQPAIVIQQGADLSCPDENQPVIRIRTGERYLINVGSVGQPRDHNPQACYVVADLDEGRISYHRVPYDIEAAQQAIVEGGLPQVLAERIAFGW